MKKIKYSILLLLSILMLGIGACTKDFDKINTDPNKPSNAPATNLLAFSLQDFAANLWDSWGDIDEPESYSGQIAKIQYIDESRYQFRTGTVENMWTYLYRELKSLQVVINAAEASDNTDLQAVATTIQCYIWQVATDRWRDIPYSGALAADSGKLTPKYDKQEDIYPSLLNKLKATNDLFNNPSPSSNVGEGDLLFGGDVAKWQKFCNSIRLRMAIRISDVDPALAKSTIETIMGDLSKNPIIESNADNAFFNWAGAGTADILTDESWYTGLYLSSRLNNYAVSSNMIDTLKELDDPRLPVYANPVLEEKEQTVYRGSVIGLSGTSAPGGLSHYSFIGDFYANNPTGYTPFMRAAEIKFILAEAAQKGWNVGTTAEEAYNEGIDLSLAENKVIDDKYKTQSNVKWNGDIKRLYLQKWIALYKDGHEAWAESRRTDVPLMAPAPASPYPGHNRPPFRYPYPASEARLNGANSKPFAANVKDNYWGQQMWWDTRKNVK